MDDGDSKASCNSSIMNKPEEEYYLIGEVSKICNIPIKTLRYYDEIGVLKPDKICKENNYRYYARNKIQQIILIRYYKYLGFKLDKIKELQSRANIKELEDSLLSRLTSIQDNIRELQKEYIGTFEWYEMLREGGSFLSSNQESLDIQVKIIPLCQTVMIKINTVSTKLSDSEILINTAFSNYCQENNIFGYGPVISHFVSYQERMNNTFAEVEYYCAVNEDTRKEEMVKAFGDFSAVTAIHKGNYESISRSYTAMLEWVKAKGLEIGEDAFEKYIIDPWSTIEPNNYVTEIILPLTKKTLDPPG